MFVAVAECATAGEVEVFEPGGGGTPEYLADIKRAAKEPTIVPSMIAKEA